MRSLGTILVIVGVVVVVLALVDHFVAHFMGSIAHGSIILGVIGVVVALVGVFMSMQRGAKAA
jgi:hypothetical protein